MHMTNTEDIAAIRKSLDQIALPFRFAVVTFKILVLLALLGCLFVVLV